jgi:transcriptional regulator with XRE-family HTH domain
MGREKAKPVPERGSPTVRGRRLAAELRRLRERTGLTGEEVAHRLGWSGSKISRIELHRIGVKQSDLRELLTLYGVDESHRDELMALARESNKKGWLEKATASFPAEYAAYLHAEAEAKSVWNWEPLVVPGLLQTPDYARAMMQGWQSMFALPPGDTERRVEARVLRQQLLTRDPPLELSVVMDESVLSRRFGDAAVMHRQLSHLVEITKLPNVEIRVLRLDGDHPIGAGAFYYLQFPQVHDIPMHDIVNIEHLMGNQYLEDEEDTYKFLVTFRQLVASSLDPESSRDLIARTADEIWLS